MQDWGAELFEALKSAGGRAYSNYAVGFNNVVVPEATKRGIPVGNTPGGCGRSGPAAGPKVEGGKRAAPGSIASLWRGCH